jgi:hypothetical protein
MVMLGMLLVKTFRTTPCMLPKGTSTPGYWRISFLQSMLVGLMAQLLRQDSIQQKPVTVRQTLRAHLPPERKDP